MWKFLVLLLVLAGCATVPVPADPGSSQARLLAARSEAQLRALVSGLHDPAGDEAIAATAATVDLARIAVAGEAAVASGGAPEHIAGFVALGVTLAYCRDGLDRIQQKRTDRDAAIRFARGEYALLCLAPLSVLAVR